MTYLNLMTAVAASCLLTGAAVAQDEDADAKDLLQRLEGVAPPEVLQNATLIDVGETGEMRTLREGTNGWTCMYPGTDPMCADAGGVAWGKALFGGAEAPPEDSGLHLHAARRRRHQQHRARSHRADRPTTNGCRPARTS